MQLTLNDILCEVPFDTSKITLGSFMEYHNEYGRDLNKLLSEIQKKEFDDEVEKVIALNDYLDQEALAWFSFWTKSDLFEVKEESFIIPVLKSYRQLRSLLQPEDETQMSFPVEIIFNKEVWCISDYKVVPASGMDFNEVITSKETIRQLSSIGKDKYDSLPYMCAIFFRKKNEAFDDSFIQEDGERMTLLKQLPLNVAYQVAFFLNSYQSTYLKTLVYSIAKEAGTPSRS